MRRLLLSLCLIAGLAPAFAAGPPPPVPALPDTERRTSYTINASTCACAVNFAIYGDSTDVDNWIEVWIGSTRYLSTDPTFGWSLSSATGPLATIPRPITDAVLTFNSNQTGTVQIVGARRPRRTTQFQENRGVAARDLNQALTDQVAQMRELWDKNNDVTGRAILGLPGETIAQLPSASARASSFICWDATGLIPLACSPGLGLGNVVGPNSSVNGHIALWSGTSGRILIDGGSPGTGTVTGPVSSTNGSFARWSGTNGLTLEDGLSIIPIGSGGTNNNLTPANGGLVYSDSAGLQILAPTATAGQIPLSGSNSAPAWSTATWPSTVAINSLLYASSANVVGALAPCASGILQYSAGNVPSCSQTLPGTVQTNITQLGTIVSGTWNGSGITGSFIQNNTVTNSNLAQAGAATLKGNPTGLTSNDQDFTINGLTNKPSPSANNDLVMIYDASTGTLKQSTVGQLSAGGTAGVVSLNGLTGGLSVVGTADLTVSAASTSVSLQPLPRGHVNRLRNSSLSSWFHGSGTLTQQTTCASTNTAANNCWGAEGIFIVPTGASVTSQQIANGLSNPLTFWAQKIIGNTSVTDVTVRFVIESYDAAPLAGQQVTCQIPVLNNTGVSITPTITVKRANAQDATYTNTDVNAASLQTITNGSTGTLAYSWAANANSFNGLSVDIDFGNNFSSNAKSIQIGGGFDCRVTPGAATGTISTPPTPEIRPAQDDIAWNQRFYEASYSNGTASGTSTHTDMVNYGWNAGSSTAEGNSITFKVTKRAAPTLSFWDGAGNATSVSWYTNGAYSDNHANNGILSVTSGINGAIISINASAAHNMMGHFTADATLIGG